MRKLAYAAALVFSRGGSAIRTNAPTDRHDVRLSNAAEGHSRHSGRAAYAQVVVSPDHRTVALLNRRSMPTIAELAQPIHRIAGARINPKTNGRQHAAVTSSASL